MTTSWFFLLILPKIVIAAPISDIQFPPDFIHRRVLQSFSHFHCNPFNDNYVTFSGFYGSKMNFIVFFVHIKL